ncbi:helix-turn-helix transcriptional regulator [Myroides odoratimimus]|nr:MULTISPECIES: helix-turn-helix transcriptional regulator [Myroides]APA93643.1 transcriptional regulator [Myroides sp. ZB35]MDM1466488.1 helix-turn-helix transcriptional regulator [Myroides odoratimimus]MDM1469638.1 helix-turn-helix transcriptional regulator [Myroides odoratimimus]MDM1479650.1 helix-turn-helix transcriptional regulator [Myroides odoratimimus]MDM1506902.1 helix-turn-helix transcriptional regulator [Myroides odoratimimus]
MHKMGSYIDIRMNKLGYTEEMVATKMNMSQSQINKLRNGNVSKLSAFTFYKAVIALGGDFKEAIRIVFPNFQKIKLKRVPKKKRNQFGTFMLKFENVKNTPKIISIKTGIPEARISDLFFRKGSLEAFELLLIEKAIDKEPGELFMNYFLNQ